MWLFILTCLPYGFLDGLSLLHSDVMSSREGRLFKSCEGDFPYIQQLINTHKHILSHTCTLNVVDPTVNTIKSFITEIYSTMYKVIYCTAAG